MDTELLRRYLVGDFTLGRLLRSVVFVYVCVAVYAWMASDGMIFQPQPCSYRDDEGIIKIAMKDGPPISALYFVNPAAKYTVLYNHANAVDLGDIRDFLEAYHARGFSVMSYDYRGYGTSPGRPTTANAYEAAEAALAYLVEEKGILTDHIIIHGRSVGGGPALYLGEKNEAAGVIVESGFVTAFRVMTRIPILPFDKMRNIARIDNVNCPVLVTHGRDDSIIPLWHGQKLFDAAEEPKMSCWLDNTTHNSISPEGERAYWAAIESFRGLLD